MKDDDKNVTCCNPVCGLICRGSKWKYIPDKKNAAIQRGVCPRCHHGSFRMTKPGEVEKPKTGAQLIALERQRQILVEGFGSKRDDKYTDGELAKAAESYLVAVTSPDEEGDASGKSRPAWDWPWHDNWWKPSNDLIRNLTKAGALIAAEIDRLQRKAQVAK